MSAKTLMVVASIVSSVGSRDRRFMIALMIYENKNEMSTALYVMEEVLVLQATLK